MFVEYANKNLARFYDLSGRAFSSLKFSNRALLVEVFYSGLGFLCRCSALSPFKCANDQLFVAASRSIVRVVV